MPGSVSTAAEVPPSLATSVPLPYPSLAGQLYPAITSVEYYLKNTVTAIDRLPLWDNRRSPHPELLVTLEQTKALRGAWCEALWDQLGVLWLNSSAKYATYHGKLSKALDGRHMAEIETICGSQARTSLHPQYAAGGSFLAALENTGELLSLPPVADYTSSPSTFLAAGGPNGSPAASFRNTTVRASSGTVPMLSHTLPMGSSVPSFASPGASSPSGTQSPQSQGSPTSARNNNFVFGSNGISSNAQHSPSSFGGGSPTGKNLLLAPAPPSFADAKIMAFAELLVATLKGGASSQKNSTAATTAPPTPEHLERTVVSYLASRGYVYDPAADIPPLTSQQHRQHNDMNNNNFRKGSNSTGHNDASTFGNSYPLNSNHDVFVSSMSYGGAGGASYMMNATTAGTGPVQQSSQLTSPNMSPNANGTLAAANDFGSIRTLDMAGMDKAQSPFASIGKITRLVLRQLYERSVLDHTCREHSHIFAKAKAQDRKLLADRLDKFNGLLMLVTDAVERKIASAALPNDDVGAMGLTGQLGLGGLVSIGGSAGATPQHHDLNPYGAEVPLSGGRNTNPANVGGLTPRRLGSPNSSSKNSPRSRPQPRNQTGKNTPGSNHSPTNANAVRTPNSNTTLANPNGSASSINRAPFGSATARTLMGSNNGSQPRLSTMPPIANSARMGVTGDSGNQMGSASKIGGGHRKSQLPPQATPPPPHHNNANGINSYINSQQNTANNNDGMTSEASITAAASSFFNNTNSNEQNALSHTANFGGPQAPHPPARAQQQSTLPTSGFLTV